MSRRRPLARPRAFGERGCWPGYDECQQLTQPAPCRCGVMLGSTAVTGGVAAACAAARTAAPAAWHRPHASPHSTRVLSALPHPRLPRQVCELLLPQRPRLQGPGWQLGGAGKGAAAAPARAHLPHHRRPALGARAGPPLCHLHAAHAAALPGPEGGRSAALVLWGLVQNAGAGG